MDDYRIGGDRLCLQYYIVSGIQPTHAKRLRMQLAALDTATTVEDMDIPRFRLKAQSGDAG